MTLITSGLKGSKLSHLLAKGTTVKILIAADSDVNEVHGSEHLADFITLRRWCTPASKAILMW